MSPTMMEVIEWFDQTGTAIVQRYPEDGSGDIKMGAQLIVRENQAAVFFRDGQALDAFGPGRHTLSTQNLPILTAGPICTAPSAIFSASVVPLVESRIASDSGAIQTFRSGSNAGPSSRSTDSKSPRKASIIVSR